MDLTPVDSSYNLEVEEPPAGMKGFGPMLSSAMKQKYDEGKANKALAAATSELEMLFKKDDVKQMQVFLDFQGSDQEQTGILEYIESVWERRIRIFHKQGVKLIFFLDFLFQFLWN